MARDAFIVFAGDADWRAARVRAGSVELRGAPPDRVADTLRGLGYAGQGVLLAAPSHWCLAASVSLDGIGASDRRAMVYRLEEKLPVAAEDVVADFVVSPDGASALGVCALPGRLRAAVDSLEAAGVAVQGITAFAMLAAQELAGDGELLAGEDGRVNVVRFEQGRSAAWSLVAGEAGDVRLELAAAGARQVRCVGVPEPLLVELGREVERIDGDPFKIAATAAARMIAGQRTPWVDLRRDALAAGDKLRTHRTALNAALAAAAVFLLALTAAAWVRGQRYERRAAEDDRHMAEAFSTHFPGWEVPPDVRGVVESEHRKTAAHSTEALPADARGSALLSLRDVLSKLADAGPDARYRLDRMRFTESSFELDGTARSPQDVQPLVAAAKAAGMEVALPQTRRDDAGAWVFSIRGSRAGAAESVATGGRPWHAP